MMFKEPVSASHKTLHVNYSSSQLVLFSEIITVYRETHTEHINTLRGHAANIRR